MGTAEKRAREVRKQGGKPAATERVGEDQAGISFCGVMEGKDEVSVDEKGRGTVSRWRTAL